MKGAIVVCGTQSNAGKSLVAAGLCRWLAGQGVRVAPFKAQNMALNSVVTRDGREVGRSQAVQAAAAGVEPEAAMNPVLLKPSGQRHSQVMVMGRPYAEADARSYQELKPRLQPLVAGALQELRRRFDVVVCEGAGSPAEINLRADDLVNLGLARTAELPVIVVADIDRGGVFASLFGTLALLDPADQAHVAGFVINKFRGDHDLLAPGLDRLQELTGRPVLGVLPFTEGLQLDAEDSLALDGAAPSLTETGVDTIDVAVIRLRWISNFTDVDALGAEPGVRVRFTRSAADVARADLVVVPGTKATVEDLERLRADGLDLALAERASAGRPILGVCGGYQLLGQRIEDEVESGRGAVPGLGLLPVVTTFAPDKVLRQRRGWCRWLETAASGYEIRHGRPQTAGEPLFTTDDGESDGSRRGSVVGFSWHGALEHDAFRRALLSWVSPAFVPAETSFASLREAQLNTLGELVGAHLDTRRLTDLIANGPPEGLPTIATEVRECCAS